MYDHIIIRLKCSVTLLITRKMFIILFKVKRYQQVHRQIYIKAHYFTKFLQKILYYNYFRCYQGLRGVRAPYSRPLHHIDYATKLS